MGNIELQKTTVGVKQGITFLASVFKAIHISRETGVHRNYLCIVTTGLRVGGLTEFPDRYIQALNDYAQRYGEQLFQTRITADNPVEQLKALGKWVNLPYLFEQVMHWKPSQYQNRISRQTSIVYGKFSAEQLTQINDAILMLAIKATSMHIATPVQENTDNKVENTAAVQDPCKKTD